MLLLMMGILLHDPIHAVLPEFVGCWYIRSCMTYILVRMNT